jgi:hypothetical protein
MYFFKQYGSEIKVKAGSRPEKIILDLQHWLKDNYERGSTRYGRREDYSPHLMCQGYAGCP